MENLKDLLQSERVVELSYSGGKILGFVESNGTRIRTARGFHEIANIDDKLVQSGICHITKVFVYNENGSELSILWDRSRDFIDWANMPIDTKVLVRNYETSSWTKRHFARYENGKVYTFDSGCTSFTAKSDTHREITSWDYVKLYKEEEDKES